MFGKPEWFNRRKYGGWGFTRKMKIIIYYKKPLSKRCTVSTSLTIRGLMVYVTVFMRGALTTSGLSSIAVQ